jgi:adenosylcobalamin-dependent ribonucleoside-triphosphate reductase
MTNFGPTGQVVYERTYSRVKPDGERETWPETVRRVVDGNLGLVDERHQLPGERDALIEMMTDFQIIPAGRHLWASGVPGRQYLFNCHVSGWGEDPAEHFEFTFLRLMEGGGVGANYSNRDLYKYEEVRGWIHGGVMDGELIPDQHYEVHIVCDPEHADYEKMSAAGLLSLEYADGWAGAYEVEDSREGWSDALVDLIGTYYRPAHNQKRVFDVSRVRPEGSRLKTFGGRASGPLPLATMLHEVAGVMNARIGDRLDGLSAMAIDHAIAKCVVSGGNRRSARMAIMHWNDPQIEDFISIKATTGEHWTTNISVEVDDDFWFLLGKMDGGPHARRVLSLISEGMLANGEPGFWDSDFSNEGEPNRVTATNPCGEIALEEWENCNLGHVNLAGFVTDEGVLDWRRLELGHRLITRFLMRATYGDVNDPKQAAVLARNRRIGVGHLGVASALAMTGLRYSEAPGSTFESGLYLLSDIVDDEAVSFAHTLRVPVPVKKRTVAPTGTIAKMPGVSEGIHPIFSRYFVRRIRFSNVDPDQRATVERYREQGYGVEPCQYAPDTTVVSLPTKDSLVAEVEARYGTDEIVESAGDLTLDEMLAFQAMYQECWADNAVSYTANVDPAEYTAKDVADVLRKYGGRLKGATIFPEMGMPQSPYERITKAEYGMYEDWQQSVSDGVDEACANGGCPVK